MQLPNGENADVPLSRLTGYLLNPDHAVGKHKARLFRAALGLDAAAAPFLQRWLQDLADGRGLARPPRQYGQRFAIIADLSYKGRSAQVRTGWIIRPGRNHPEFLPAIILE